MPEAPTVAPADLRKAALILVMLIQTDVEGSESRQPTRWVRSAPSDALHQLDATECDEVAVSGPSVAATGQIVLAADMPRAGGADDIRSRDSLRWALLAHDTLRIGL